MEDLEFHEAAGIFPLDEEHLPELVEDIRRHGLLVPIETLGGKILDGRRRFLACQQAGVTPRFREASTDDPIAHSWSLNGPRRHLTPAQRAMAGARMRELYDLQAKERQKRRPAGSVPANLPEQKSDARDQVGKVVGVSGKTVDHATKVLANAVPEVIKAVDEGRMAVSTAAILSSEPEEVQRAEAENPKRQRNYKSVSKPPDEDGEADEPANGDKPKGVGIRLAHEAINCLTRIPKNDHFRKRGFQIVTDWIRNNR